MRYQAYVLVALIASAGAAWAEQDLQKTQFIFAESREDVGRETSQLLKAGADANLKPASVSQIDTNNDGFLSFEELARFEK